MVHITQITKGHGTKVNYLIKWQFQQLSLGTFVFKLCRFISLRSLPCNISLLWDEAEYMMVSRTNMMVQFNSKVTFTHIWNACETHLNSCRIHLDRAWDASMQAQNLTIKQQQDLHNFMPFFAGHTVECNCKEL